MIDVLDILREANPDAIDDGCIAAGCRNAQDDHLLDVTLTVRIWILKHPAGLDPVALAGLASESVSDPDEVYLLQDFEAIDKIVDVRSGDTLYEPVE